MKKKTFRSLIVALTLILVSLSFSAGAVAQSSGKLEPLVIQQQGSFAVGGTVISTPGTFNPNKPFEPAGQTLHGDHAYAFYQKPVNARKYPLTFLHGAGQFSKTWESTPDGREGFQNIFLRRNFSVYLLDQPRRGGAGRSTVAMNLTPNSDDQMWFQQFRLGVWPDFYPGVQFPKDEESLNQYFRQMTPNTGPFDMDVISDAIAALYARTGPGILVTHSQGGGPGWASVMKSPNIKAVVTYESGSGFPFPDNEVPAPIPNRFNKQLEAYGVPMEDFKKLTRIPIVVYYGDNIPNTRHENPALDYWYAAVQMAEKWAETVNKHGGDVTVVHLPKVGIKGNTHFPFSDLNNVEVADHLSAWLAKKGLD
ncbi:alpha/beta fold hydrolase [Desulfosarcina sp. OttesenSCG-928-B08]|nr:alpha/beta fold hydrolase [Desulfosarcina sp. OttesenSCG-928-B08]